MGITDDGGGAGGGGDGGGGERAVENERTRDEGAL